MKKGICKLCTEEKNLIGISHIIPQFLYSGIELEGQSGTMMQLKSTPRKYQKQKPIEKKKVQTGAFDKYILCEECDNRILGSELENYVKDNFFDLINKAEISEPIRLGKSLGGQEYLMHTSLNFEKTKRFFLSVLWRASISNHEHFSCVTLENSEEETLRKIIKDKSAENIDYWHLLLFGKKDRRSTKSDSVRVFSTPEVGYAFVVGELIMIFFKPNNPQMKKWTEFSYYGRYNLKVVLGSTDLWAELRKEQISQIIRSAEANFGKQELLEFIRQNYLNGS